jgi:hypothetical protein
MATFFNKLNAYHLPTIADYPHFLSNARIELEHTTSIPAPARRHFAFSTLSPATTMPSLPSDLAVHVANYHMGNHGDKEYPVVTFLVAMQKVYLHDPNIINAGKKPPTASAADQHRRVDSIPHWCQNGSSDFNVRAVYECKRPDATPKEIEICEAQVYDACERNVRDRQTGRCYGFSGFGSFWRVFILEKPSQRFTRITGEGDSTRKHYVDVSDSEGMLIDSCFQDLREHMG